MSVSKIPDLWPSLAKASARFAETVLLPTPPLALDTAMTLATSFMLRRSGRPRCIRGMEPVRGRPWSGVNKQSHREDEKSSTAYQGILMLQDAQGAEEAALDGRHDRHVDNATLDIEIRGSVRDTLLCCNRKTGRRKGILQVLCYIIVGKSLVQLKFFQDGPNFCNTRHNIYVCVRKLFVDETRRCCEGTPENGSSQTLCGPLSSGTNHPPLC